MVSEKARKTAKIISFIFDGSFLSIPLFVIIALEVSSNAFLAIGYAAICTLFIMVIPYLYILFLLKRKRINDVHLPVKGNRMRPLIVMDTSFTLCYFILYLLDAPDFLRTMILASLFTVVMLTVITIFWKISFHASWITFVSITLCILYGKWALLTFILLPLVAWARVIIKRHTIMQVIAGACVTVVTSLFTYNLFGYFHI